MFFYHAHPRKDVGLNFVLKNMYNNNISDDWSDLLMIHHLKIGETQWQLFWLMEERTIYCFWSKKKILYYSAGLKILLPHYIDGLSVYLSKYLVLQIFMSKKYGIRFYIFLFFDQNGVNWKHVVYNFEFLNKMTKKLL